MSENPYAPPEADVTRATSPDGTGTFTIGQAFSDAWSNLWSNFPTWIWFSIVAGLTMILSTFTVIGIFLVWPGILFGSTLFLLRMHDGNASVGDFKAGFSPYFPKVLSGLGLGASLLLITYAGQIPYLAATLMESTIGMVLGYLLSLIWQAITIRFYFSVFLWVDRGTGPIEALGESWNLSRPVFWRMIGLLLLMSVIFIPVIIVIMVAMIPAIATESIAMMALSGSAAGVMGLAG